VIERLRLGHHFLCRCTQGPVHKCQRDRRDEDQRLAEIHARCQNQAQDHAQPGEEIFLQVVGTLRLRLRGSCGAGWAGCATYGVIEQARYGGEALHSI